MTRILAVADQSFDWPDDIDARCHNADWIISLGDLGFHDVQRVTGHGFTPVAGVYGNHCNRGYLEELNCIDLSGGGIAGVFDTPFGSVMGISGCVRYKEGTSDVLYTQDEYREILEVLPPVDIVVSHCPPLGCNDHTDPAHVGIEALAAYVLEHRPKHLFHGHTYPNPPMTKFYRTNIHYVHGWSEVEID